MAKRKRTSWNAQILRIENKGREAYFAGFSEHDNPYQSGHGNQNGPGGQLQRQRRYAWGRGWLMAKNETLDKLKRGNPPITYSPVPYGNEKP